MKNKITYLVSFEYLPFSYGGLARHATEMISRLLEIDDQYTAIIAIPINNKNKINNKIVKIPCVFFNNKYLCYLEFSLKIFFKFRKNFNNSRFIFFSALSYLFIPFLPDKYYLFVLDVLKRMSIISYPEESICAKIARKTIYYFLSHWERYLSKKAEKVFAISNSTKNDLFNYYGLKKGKVSIISCALNTELFKRGVPRTKIGNNLLYVGKLVPRKNIEDLINIMEYLVKVNLRFVLHIVGKGEKKYFRRLNEKISNNKLCNNIRFYGYLPDTQLNVLYKKCDLFVFTSLIEGFGLVLLEAMSKGLPIVAYNVNGVKDVIINNVNGYLVKSFDYQDFANKIISLYKNKGSYKEMSKNALKRVKDFDWDKSTMDLDKILRFNL